MRVTTAFKRLLRLPGVSVIDVAFGAEEVIVTVRLLRRPARGAARAVGSWRSTTAGSSAGATSTSAPTGA